ncbi:P2X purinoceptor 7 [Spea bombifrons]|uniref:P2X purinoceptor 7 n=1 Tax=Spea bombifrons TaxID=233779 RepID=UPI00234AC259|nr:P2X purinoceptor 7 [Spea bombifrons]
MSCFEYTTQKDVRIRSIPLGILKYFISLSVFVYMCCILITEKGYQEKDSVISSVHTKVKGVLDAENRIWDTAEYTIPSLGTNSFFVLTNIVKTENQAQGFCPEFPNRKTICSRDDICKKGYADPQSNGIQTGRCVQYNSSYKTCEIRAWCPVESKNTPDPAVLGSAENLTVLIKNTIHFAEFNYTTKNILPEYNVSCIYHRIKAPHCPIFRLGDVFKEAGESFSQVAVLGGIMGIEINWNCDLDFWAFSCRPHYSFRRLDDKVVDERLYPGLNFRFARYYQSPNRGEQRTLIKATGIRFDIQVYGTGGQFRWFRLIIFIGSYLSYFGLATVLIDVLIGLYCESCCDPKSSQKFYDDLKYEKVTGPSILTSCQKLRFVSFVDHDEIIMVDKALNRSLQKTRGRHIKREAFANITETIPQNYSETTTASEAEAQPLTKGNLDQTILRPPWCQCSKCSKMKAFEDQLCCRLEDGECITRSDMFKRLVLSRETLLYVLQYSNPLLKASSVSNTELLDCAKKQYIRWRFASNKVVLDFAVIPNCCKHEIERVFKHDFAETSFHDVGASSSSSTYHSSK